ncbi:MAG: hypothetical protein M3R47_12710 [Chloroflexota bacterium]|nr:hypothetical protein [Chloroflexota bacterium]
MNIKYFLSKLWKYVPILIVLAILIVCLQQVILVANNLPQGQSREDITMEEAQSLVSFPICVPTYIAPGIDSNLSINYLAEEVNNPDETYIRLLYKRIEDRKEVIEVIQNYTPDKGLKAEDSKFEREAAKINLLNWMYPLRFFSRSKLDATKEQIQMEANVSKTDETVWWLYEIVDPREYRSTMTKWVVNNVEYRIFSYLPAEEIKKVTLAMLECSTQSP